MKRIKLLPNGSVQRVEEILDFSWRILKTSVLNSTSEEVYWALRIPLTAITKDQGLIVSLLTSGLKLIVPLKSRDKVDRIEPDL